MCEQKSVSERLGDFAEIDLTGHGLHFLPADAFAFSEIYNLISAVHCAISVAQCFANQIRLQAFRYTFSSRNRFDTPSKLAHCRQAINFRAFAVSPRLW